MLMPACAATVASSASSSGSNGRARLLSTCTTPMVRPLWSGIGMHRIERVRKPDDLSTSLLKRASA